MNNYAINYAAITITNFFRFDLKEFAISKLRGFKAEKNYIEKFLYRPCTSNIYFLRYRL